MKFLCKIGFHKVEHIGLVPRHPLYKCLRCRRFGVVTGEDSQGLWWEWFDTRDLAKARASDFSYWYALEMEAALRQRKP